MNRLKKIIVEIDGKETEYRSLSECAKVLGVTAATLSQCAACGYKCKGHNVRYADGTRRARKRSTAKATTTDGTRRARKRSTVKATTKTTTTADDVLKLIARWYTTEWEEYISSVALISLTTYIREHWNLDA